MSAFWHVLAEAARRVLEFAERHQERPPRPIVQEVLEAWSFQATVRHVRQRPSFPENRIGYQGEIPLPASAFRRREAWRREHWWRRLLPLATLGRSW